MLVTTVTELVEAVVVDRSSRDKNIYYFMNGEAHQLMKRIKTTHSSFSCYFFQEIKISCFLKAANQNVNLRRHPDFAFLGFVFSF